ncbi:hypothetical protein KIW84_034789 [Lathyrus oleraceus]|uniref:H15 domain-containing protein n=1 Tax=Pisum sativum TaxID=3888 RepID=A0A9D4Y0B7_PEA|nr:hypothetical protein KIW84_034789 [Pisum sativum]
MIIEAITNLKERTGSSQFAETKFIKEKHEDSPPTYLGAGVNLQYNPPQTRRKKQNGFRRPVIIKNERNHKQPESCQDQPKPPSPTASVIMQPSAKQYQTITVNLESSGCNLPQNHNHSTFIQSIDGSLVDKRPGVHPETYNKRLTFVSRIKSWWPFQKSNAKADDSTAYQNKATSNLEDFKLPELDQPASNLEKPKPLEPHQRVS